MKYIICFLFMAFSCTNTPSTKGTFGFDLEFLQKSEPGILVLEDTSGDAKIIISPNLQGRVMTSTADGDQGTSFGWLNYNTAEISDRDTDAIVNIESNADGSPAGGLIVSGKTKEYGMLLGVDYQKSEDDAGFKTRFDNKHEKTDILFKINAASLAGARNPQTTEFSYHFTDTKLDNSRVGLSENDFSKYLLPILSAHQMLCERVNIIVNLHF